MFGIGFFEILVIAVLGLLVFGPEKLPEAIRTFAFGFSKAKRTWQATRRELEQELGMDDIRREIHNAQIMENLEKMNSGAKEQISKVESELTDNIGLASHNEQADDQSADSPVDKDNK